MSKAGVWTRDDLTGKWAVKVRKGKVNQKSMIEKANGTRQLVKLIKRIRGNLYEAKVLENLPAAPDTIVEQNPVSIEDHLMEYQNHILLYTDGACWPNPGPGGWGALVVEPNGVSHSLCGREDKTTSNRMETQALIEGLEFIADMSCPNLVVFMDSLLVIKQITKGYARNANQDLWSRLNPLLEEFTEHKEVHWQWVKGHSGIEGNEIADSLAGESDNGARKIQFAGGANCGIMETGCVARFFPLIPPRGRL